MSYTNNPYKTIPKAWGLYQKDDNKAIPLKSLHISVQIVHNTARVFFTQEYYNDFNAALETEFFFPISPDACFDSFQAKFSDTIITGVVKQKQQAQGEYKQAISSGKTAAYSEINPDTGDIMKVLIGNIPPMSPISVTYSYVEKLTVSLNKFWCFRLFSSITPRYNGSLSNLLKADVTLLAAYPTISDKASTAYPWHIDVEIQSPSAISTVKSPSHGIVSKYGNENHTCTVTLDHSGSQKHTPSKDFVLLFSHDKTDQVESVLTPFEDGYCAMVSIMASFGQAGYEETYDNFMKAKEVKERHSTTEVRGEYIFLIDQSGSMSGGRIEMAKNSLILFLKSLPKDSLFNVVSFGTDYSFMHAQSAQASQQSLEISCNKIKSFAADMGGTEIFSCLKCIFDQPLKKGYPRFVFLLTDGEISNTNEVLDLVKENSNKAQVFTVGIGSGCSAELITKTAYYGRGKHEFVVDSQEISEKVVSLLDSSLSPCLSDFSFHADNFDAIVKNVSPNPATVPFLLNGQTATYFLFLRKEAFTQETNKMTVKVRMYDSRVRNYRTVDLSLDNRDVIDNEMIVKLGIHSMIQDMEFEKESEKESDKESALDIFDLFKIKPEIREKMLKEKEEIRKSLVELSVKYGILCKETAFICEMRQKGKVSLQTSEKIKITVPAIAEPKDYFGWAGSSAYTSRLPISANNYTSSGYGFGGLPAPQFASFSMPSNNYQSRMDSEGFDDFKIQKVSNASAFKDFGMPAPSIGVSGMKEKDSKPNNASSGFAFHMYAPETKSSVTNQKAPSYTTAPATTMNSNQYDLLDLDFQSLPNTGVQMNSVSSNLTIASDFGHTVSHNTNSASNDLSGFDSYQPTPTSASANTFTSYNNINTQIPQNVSQFSQTAKNNTFDPFSSFESFQSVPLSNKMGASYLDVVILQNFDGYWDHNNPKLLATVLRTPTLQQAPAQIRSTSSNISTQTVWMTILVLLWLETACAKDQKAWLLIHQKGCEWLREQGVDYEATKQLGQSYI